MKFKVGDKVRVKEDLVCGRMYGLNKFVRPMEQYRGQVFRIAYIFRNQYEFDDIGYLFTEEMVEEVKEVKVMKFKVGDKVKVREDLVVNECYDEYTFSEGMEEYKGNIVEIKEVLWNAYTLKGIGYHWSDAMLKEFKEEIKEDTVMKFSVGDKVRVREDLVEGEYYGYYMFSHDMKEYKGCIFEISKVLGHEYLLKDMPSFLWTNEMLELVKNEENNVSIKRSVCLEYTNSNGEIKHFFLGDEVEVIDDTTTSYTGRITSVTLDSISMDCSSKFEAKVIEKYIADILEIRPYNEDEI